jgi:hypothetical protein
MWLVLGRREICTGCLWGDLSERDHWGDPDVDGKIILRWNIQKVGVFCGDWMKLTRIVTGGVNL